MNMLEDSPPEKNLSNDELDEISATEWNIKSGEAIDDENIQLEELARLFEEGVEEGEHLERN